MLVYTLYFILEREDRGFDACKASLTLYYWKGQRNDRHALESALVFFFLNSELNDLVFRPASLSEYKTLLIGWSISVSAILAIGLQSYDLHPNFYPSHNMVTRSSAPC